MPSIHFRPETAELWGSWQNNLRRNATPEAPPDYIFLPLVELLLWYSGMVGIPHKRTLVDIDNKQCDDIVKKRQDVDTDPWCTPISIRKGFKSVSNLDIEEEPSFKRPVTMSEPWHKSQHDTWGKINHPPPSAPAPLYNTVQSHSM